MDVAFKASRAFLTTIAFLAGSAALAQHEAAAPPSPYSLGLSVTRAPFTSSAPSTATCPATLLYCAPSQGLNLSVVGRAHVASSLGVFGKVGATSYSRPDTSVMGMAGTPLLPEPSGGLSWGGGVSWSFTPRLTASFEWVSYDLRMTGGPVRTTSLGLQYRY
jgi:hypothetical protein